MAKSNLPALFAETANQRYIEAHRFWGNWRGQARLAFDFVAGDQWLQDDKQLLESQKRPPITFNYSEKMIDAVVGAEVAARQEITYGPREINDAPVAELYTNAAKWVRDQGNIEDEETDAFRDTLICGMGWTHTKVSFDTDPNGMIETHRVDPMEMLSDPSARKPGVADRRYCFRDFWIDEKEAMKNWPNASFLGQDTGQDGRGVQVIRHGERYEDGVDTDADIHRGQVQIRHYECVELEPYFRVQLEDGSAQDVEPDVFFKMKKNLDKDGVRYVKMQRRVYYFAWFSGETLLEADKSPTQEGFTYGCITGKRDRNKNTWYGLTKVMMDPQRWANKWLSQILHIINSNAKGGLLAEVNAFVDAKKAQDDWAMPESITMLKEGGIAKIKEKQMTAFPTGLDKLMEFALASLPQVTGINLEALGLAGRDQANVLEQSRKQAAYGLLAPVFDSLRRYRKHQGRVLLDLIRNFISDGRLIRIGGEESQQFLPLLKAPESFKYDVVVDQSPTAPDVKRDTWNQLQNLIPAALKAGMPIPPTLFKYAPIPTKLATEWEQYMQQGQSNMKPEEAKKLQEENQQLKQALQDKSAEMQMKMEQQKKEFELKAQIAELQAKIKEAEMVQKLQIAQAEASMNMQMQQQSHEQNLAINAQNAQRQDELERQNASREPATSKE